MPVHSISFDHMRSLQARHTVFPPQRTSFDYEYSSFEAIRRKKSVDQSKGGGLGELGTSLFARTKSRRIY